MLSIEHPEVCQEALQFPGGIHCVRLQGEGMPRLILKLPVSYLLPMKLNRGFRIYVVPVEVAEIASAGLMCAFDDDGDSPLTTWRMLARDQETLDLLHALSRQEVLVHLFDEHNRELAGYLATVDAPLMARVRLEHIKYLDLDHETLHAAHEEATIWFGLRQPADDSDALRIAFKTALFPDDLILVDARPEMYRFHGGTGHGFTSLERPEPGLPQELDIVLLLQRVFRADQIYHAPRRHYDNEEIADVLVVTDDVCLVIQAKDSPNTAQTLQRSLERKRATIKKQLREALGQVIGAVNYIDRTRPLRMRVENREIEIDVAQRNVLSLVVMRELFLNDYDTYSQLLFEAFERLSLPCLALDYGELHTYTTFCPEEAKFIGAYFEVFNFAMAHGVFPRLRFGANDVEALWRAHGQSAKPD